MFAELEAQIQALYNEAVELVYYMRGGVPLSEALELTRIERITIQDFLKKHLESESKKMNPNY